jgi:hypothetical protein
LSSVEETRSEFNQSTGAIKLGIDVHQDFYVVVVQEGAVRACNHLAESQSPLDSQTISETCPKIKHCWSKIEARGPNNELKYSLQLRIATLGVEK